MGTCFGTIIYKSSICDNFCDYVIFPPHQNIMRMKEIFLVNVLFCCEQVLGFLINPTFKSEQVASNTIQQQIKASFQNVKSMNIVSSLSLCSI